MRVVMQNVHAVARPNVRPFPSPVASPPLTANDSPTPVAVVIPCYRVTRHILDVIAGIGPIVDRIYVVDDACPDGSGDLVRHRCQDQRVRGMTHDMNQGVGGATMTGMRQAIADSATIIIKMDGDGQMDPSKLPILVNMIQSGEADYAKGNRFFDPTSVRAMPPARLIGNAGLSFLSKLSTGYWQSFDPTNGYFAIHADVARMLPFQKLDRRYFFESDMMFRLSTVRARVVDVPMPAIYGDETSHLNPARSILPFAAAHLRNFIKRIGYNYFLRDFSLATAQLVMGFILILFGLTFGLLNWGTSMSGASAGVVMMAGLPVLLGMQLLLAFLAYDIQSSPASAVHPRMLAWDDGTTHTSDTNDELGTCNQTRTQRSTTNA
jgi:dolichol-phosphate mannosyltransferase